MQNEDPKPSAMEILYFISPAAVVVLIPFVGIFEAGKLSNSVFVGSIVIAAQTLLVLIIGGVFATALIIVEMKLLKLTSSLSLSILGHVKEVIHLHIYIYIRKCSMSNLIL